MKLKDNNGVKFVRPLRYLTGQIELRSICRLRLGYASMMQPILLTAVFAISGVAEAQITICSWLDRHKQEAVNKLPAIIARDDRLKNWEYETPDDILKYQYFRHKKKCGIAIPSKDGIGPPILVKFDNWSLEFNEIEIIDIVE